MNRDVYISRIIELFDFFATTTMWVRYRAKQAVLEGVFRAFTNPDTEDLILWAADIFSNPHLNVIDSLDWDTSMAQEALNRINRENLDQEFPEYQQPIYWWGGISIQNKMNTIIANLTPTERRNIEGSIADSEKLLCDLIEDETLMMVRSSDGVTDPIAITSG